ncbi:unnamed protein product [Adineta steineri]|uniref:Endonuclease/exonuclease/phosphatase domain-containing protein n=1 Tax=Adineta steineri TaxID=433720 RepID=A0A816CGH7_9BILA|nr:unnamed protein product [Adineta steineri]CAF1624496.1 unnamed protein product [Adineta steineri]
MKRFNDEHTYKSICLNDDDGDGIECPLSGAEALVVCKEFASMTDTNTGLAMVMLQKNEWNLQCAVSAYQDSMQGKSKTSQKQTISTSDVKRVKCEPSITTSVPIDNKTNATTRFKVLSWNIDGLDEQENTIDIRTRGVIDVIKRYCFFSKLLLTDFNFISEEPDAVFLQEVIPITFDLIRNLLPDYDSYAGNTEGYFVVILTRRELFKVYNFEIIPYPGTNMGRNLLIVYAMYKNSIEIDLMTSHHESGTEDIASKERMEQLKLCFKHMSDAPSHRIVLFGGDLNI